MVLAVRRWWRVVPWSRSEPLTTRCTARFHQTGGRIRVEWVNPSATLPSGGGNGGGFSHGEKQQGRECRGGMRVLRGRIGSESRGHTWEVTNSRSYRLFSDSCLKVDSNHPLRRKDPFNNDTADRSRRFPDSAVGLLLSFDFLCVHCC